MPAIQPARLKQQAALLAESYNQPATFIRSLHYLLDFYSDRAHRPGQSGAPRTLLKAYHVRPPVLRQLTLELVYYVEKDPQGGLQLCNALWEQDYLEFRLLAIYVLGKIPCDPPEPVIDQIDAWLSQRLESRLVTAILGESLEKVRQKYPERILGQVETWLESDSQHWQQIGLRTLLLLIADPSYENVPAFYRMVQPFIRQAPSTLRPFIADVIEALIDRSPQETAYFLRQCLDSPDSPDTPWMVRRTLEHFPSEQQERLRQALRGANKL